MADFGDPDSHRRCREREAALVKMIDSQYKVLGEIRDIANNEELKPREVRILIHDCVKRVSGG